MLNCNTTKLHMEDITNIITEKINKEIEKRLSIYVNKDLNYQFDIEKIFDYEDLYSKIQVFYKNENSIPLKKLTKSNTLIAIQKFFKELNLDIKIYYGVINTLHCSSPIYSYARPIIYTFYTNTNLIIEINNINPSNGANACIRFYTKDDSSIDLSLVANPGMGDYLMKSCQYSQSVNSTPFNKEECFNILNKTIKYINPNIYIDYLTICDEPTISSVFNKDKENEKINILEIKNKQLIEQKSILQTQYETYIDNILKSDNEKIEKLEQDNTRLTRELLLSCEDNNNKQYENNNLKDNITLCTSNKLELEKEILKLKQENNNLQTQCKMDFDNMLKNENELIKNILRLEKENNKLKN